MAVDCIFLKTKQRKGYYVKLTREGKSIDAYRYFYEQQYGKIPQGKVLDHLCRNKSCINTKHLEMVTIKENTRRGKSTKLNYQKVNDIRKLYKKGIVQTMIATIFNVGQDQISRIVNKRRWA